MGQITTDQEELIAQRSMMLPYSDILETFILDAQIYMAMSVQNEFAKTEQYSLFHAFYTFCIGG